MNEQVITVNHNDFSTGVVDKMEAHRKGILHRAFSIFIFNSKNELLLQRRAKVKYHSGGLWTNTCCGHPRPGEEISDTAIKRLQEEMGIACTLSFAFSFEYHVTIDNNLSEHEYDHIFTGRCDAEPEMNPNEVDEWKFMSAHAISDDLAKAPEKYTAWFKLCFDKVKEFLMKHEK